MSSGKNPRDLHSKVPRAELKIKLNSLSFNEDQADSSLMAFPLMKDQQIRNVWNLFKSYVISSLKCQPSRPPNPLFFLPLLAYGPGARAREKDPGSGWSRGSHIYSDKTCGTTTSATVRLEGLPWDTKWGPLECLLVCWLRWRSHPRAIHRTPLTGLVPQPHKRYLLKRHCWCCFMLASTLRSRRLSNLRCGWRNLRRAM